MKGVPLHFAACFALGCGEGRAPFDDRGQGGEAKPVVTRPAYERMPLLGGEVLFPAVPHNGKVVVGYTPARDGGCSTVNFHVVDKSTSQVDSLSISNARRVARMCVAALGLPDSPSSGYLLYIRYDRATDPQQASWYIDGFSVYSTLSNPVTSLVGRVRMWPFRIEDMGELGKHIENDDYVLPTGWNVQIAPATESEACLRVWSRPPKSPDTPEDLLTCWPFFDGGVANFVVPISAEAYDKYGAVGPEVSTLWVAVLTRSGEYGPLEMVRPSPPPLGR